jgi:hypothetical protein
MPTSEDVNRMLRIKCTPTRSVTALHPPSQSPYGPALFSPLLTSMLFGVPVASLCVMLPLRTHV